ncbi:MAG: sugar phosphate isomerase/epimerase [Pseudomonadota bacterium]
MTSVRTFGLALAAGVIIAGCTSSEPPAPVDQSEDVRQLDKIGVQLYTLRSAMEQDFEGTLHRVADLGYDQVEFAGFFGRDPADVRALLDELGLEPVASHVNWQALRENPQQQIDETVALGAKFIILAWMPEEERQTLDQWRDWVALMNEVGEMASEKGIQFAYHNHAFEFEPIDGVEPYDLILDGIDRNHVKLELDLYWLALAGRAPARYFEAYPGGFVLSHVKDMSADDQSMTAVGDGSIDFPSIFAQSDQSGMAYFIVEHDNPEDPFASVERSITHLRQLTY